jgi:alkylhydroperoxidase family enzyme
MKPMFLRDVEAFEGQGTRAEGIARLRSAGLPVPQLWHNFAFKTDRTDHLQAFTHGVMRGPSPLSPGERELIAAFTSKKNRCPY